MTSVQEALSKSLLMKDLDDLKHYLWMEITRDRQARTISLSQEFYINNVLKRFEMGMCTPTATPLPLQHLLTAPAVPTPEACTEPYPELVGSLMYAMMCTRPDLTYPVSVLSRYVAPRRFTDLHWQAAKRVLRYLQGTKSHVLTLGGLSPPRLEVPSLTHPHPSSSLLIPPHPSSSLLNPDLYPTDIREFHAFYRAICDRYHPALYAAAKAQCDGYFYLPARGEHRGVGGIFFDDLDRIPPPHAPLAFSPSAAPAAATAGGSGEEGFERAHRFTVDVARGFMDSFWPIVDRRRGLAFTEEQRQWQLERRGRYLEFNLLYDRGVKFGMDGNGRVESIMVSGERRGGGRCVKGEGRRWEGGGHHGVRSAAGEDGEVRAVRGGGHWRYFVMGWGWDGKWVVLTD
ncbi:unnamed protein product [Closterium sp. NIES-54]